MKSIASRIAAIALPVLLGMSMLSGGGADGGESLPAQSAELPTCSYLDEMPCRAVVTNYAPTDDGKNFCQSLEPLSAYTEPGSESTEVTTHCDRRWPFRSSGVQVASAPDSEAAHLRVVLSRQAVRLERKNVTIQRLREELRATRHQ